MSSYIELFNHATCFPVMKIYKKVQTPTTAILINRDKYIDFGHNDKLFFFLQFLTNCI